MIRMLARELYRVYQKVERLEADLLSAPPEKRESIEFELKKALAEKIRLKRQFDGRIDR